jgi:hypothetical protein
VNLQERFWTRRLRWRFRGAWQWPSFFALTIADAFVLQALPPLPHPLGLVPSLIVACFGNLILVGAIAPWLARRLMMRGSVAGASAAPTTTPAEVLHDRVATGLVVAGTVGLVAAGLAARPLVISETKDSELNARVVRAYVLGEATPEFKRNLDTANTVQLGSSYYRTCIAADDRRRALCLLVDTKPQPPALRVDSSTTPNPSSSGGM